MTDQDDRRLAPDAWGVHEHWVDAHDEVRRISRDTLTTLRRAIGDPPDDIDDRAPVVTRPGRPLAATWTGRTPPPGPGDPKLQVRCEDGTERTLGATVPDDFPLGYHALRLPDGRERRLIVSPGRCWLPEDWRAWGWTVQLYAARSTRSCGIGDLADLRALREWSVDAGAGFLLVNPLHAVGPTLPQEASPYLPATRRFRNPIYLRLEEVPGASPADEARLGLNDDELIDRDRIWVYKDRVLRAAFAAWPPTGAERVRFEDWRSEQGAALEEFATWSALAREHGPDWRRWPQSLHDPHGAEVERFAGDHAAEVAYHAWLQWLLEEQLRAATADLTVIQDLPIGVAGGGADAWAWQGVLAGDASVGAPPDVFNTAGQDWGSPPLVPWRLRAADYQPFIESIRATMAGAGGIRIDHVMGLFRLWWVPAGGSPTEGGYVRYPSEDLLDIVALESHRARALVVGEDLGTVEPGVREALAERRILSYRLAWFEEDPPEEWPALALAAVSTHDLPTVAGLCSGSDVEDQLAHTTMSEQDVAAGAKQLLSRLDPVEDRAPVDAAYELVARAPSVLLSATLEDAVGQEARPNLPGSTDRPNWCIPLPVAVDDLPAHPGARHLAGLLNEAVRPPARRR
jgi:4-alpha-glucanotransferase